MKKMKKKKTNFRNFYPLVFKLTTYAHKTLTMNLTKFHNHRMHTFEDMRLFLGPNLKMDSNIRPPEYIVCLHTKMYRLWIIVIIFYSPIRD